MANIKFLLWNKKNLTLKEINIYLINFILMSRVQINIQLDFFQSFEENSKYNYICIYKNSGEKSIPWEQANQNKE